MPFPLTFPAEKNVFCPAYQTPVRPNSYIMQSKVRKPKYRNDTVNL